MSFKDAVFTCFQKYADFSGRARRSEFWYFSLFTFIVSTVLTLLLGSVIGGIFDLIVLLPSLAVSWRRLHDINKSGAWNLIFLVPIVGAILLLVWYCTDTKAGDNRFGPSPKE